MYTYKHTVRYSELDSDGKLDIGALINYFQDSSNSHSDSLGVGYEYLKEKGQSWVLASWQIEILRLPVMGEEVEIGTFPYEFKKALGSRNFFLKDQDGNFLVKANSLWMLVNLSTMAPQLPDEKMLKAYVLEKPLEMDYTKRHIALLEKVNEAEPVTVKRAHLDTNKHVNNGQYIKMALEYTRQDMPICAIRVEYKKSAFYGDIMYPYVAENETAFQVSFKDRNGKPYVNVEFVKRR